MYGVGDWVIDKQTGQIGEVIYKNMLGAVLQLGNTIVFRYPDQLELAPLDIREEDLTAMVDLALATNDRDWFMELSEQIQKERVLEW